MIEGRELTTIDINKKYTMGELKGNEIWSFIGYCEK